MGRVPSERRVEFDLFKEETLTMVKTSQENKGTGSLLG